MQVQFLYVTVCVCVYCPKGESIGNTIRAQHLPATAWLGHLDKDSPRAVSEHLSKHSSEYSRAPAHWPQASGVAAVSYSPCSEEVDKNFNSLWHYDRLLVFAFCLSDLQLRLVCSASDERRKSFIEKVWWMTSWLPRRLTATAQPRLHRVWINMRNDAALKSLPKVTLNYKVFSRSSELDNSSRQWNQHWPPLEDSFQVRHSLRMPGDGQSTTCSTTSALQHY